MTPQLRFKGFHDDWEEKKLGEILEVIKDGHKLDNDTLYTLVTVKRNNGGVTSRGSFYGKDIAVKNYFYIHTNDLLISKRQIVHGAFGIVPTEMNKAVVSNEYLVIRFPEENINFVNELLSIPRYTHLFYLSSYGIDIEKMVFNFEDWKRRVVFLPSLPEQEKIGQFFSLLDQRIEKQEEKVKLLKERKKGWMQKIFNQEIRFKDENGNDYPDWEEKKLGDIAENFIGGGTPSTKIKEFWENGRIPWIQSSDISKEISNELVVRKYITEEAIKNSAAKLIPKNSIAVVTRVGVGKVALIHQPYSTSQDFLSFVSIQGNERFWLYQIKKIMEKQSVYLQGTSIKGITKDEVLKVNAMVPSLPEQEKIASFLSTQDELVEKEEKKLSLLKEQKKGLLQRMFV